jgi:hypothetical protein
MSIVYQYRIEMSMLEVACERAQAVLLDAQIGVNPEFERQNEFIVQCARIIKSG